MRTNTKHSTKPLTIVQQNSAAKIKYLYLIHLRINCLSIFNKLIYYHLMLYNVQTVVATFLLVT